MVEDNRQYAYFALAGSFDPAEITARMGLEPTDSWKEGDISPKTNLERRFSRWTLRSRLPEGQQLEDHVRDVLVQLDSKRDNVRQAVHEFGGCMQLVGYFFACYPGLHFDRDIIERLGAYGLEVDCDFYGLYSHRREDTD